MSAARFGADAGHLRQPIGPGFQHVQCLIPEPAHNQPGGGRAYALNQPGGQIFFDIAHLFGQQGFIGIHANLCAVFPMFHHGSVKDRPFPHRQKGQRAHGGEFLSILQFNGKHGEAVLLVAVDDILYHSFKISHRYARSLRRFPRPPEAGCGWSAYFPFYQSN